MSLGEISALDQVGFPLLSVLLFFPLGVALALRYVNESRVRGLALVGALVELVLAVWLIVAFQDGSSALQFTERGPQIDLLGFGYTLGVDGISVLFVPLTVGLTLLVVIHSEYAVKSDARHYLMAVFALEASIVGIFVSIDLLLFWIFFVAELVPSYVLITRFGAGAQRVRAAREYVGFMSVGSLLMLAGFVVLAIHGPGALSFRFLDLLGAEIPPEMQTLIFFLVFIGLAVKAPIFPFHTWMPKVLEEGPIVGISVFLVGIKIGTYGFLRFVIPLVPDASARWFWVMVLLGSISMVYGAAIALVQTNLRRLLAFSSLSHMGVVMLGMFSLDFAGFQGGLLQMINLGITGAGLFFVASFLHTRVGPPEIGSLGGLVHTVPFLSATYLIIALAGVGLPGTSGFNGEHLVMLGALERNWVLGVVTGLGTVLTAAYFLSFFQQAFMREADPGPSPRMPDLRLRETIVAVALGVMIFWIGLYTTPFLAAMNGSLEALDEHAGVVKERDVGRPVPGADEDALGVERRGER